MIKYRDNWERAEDESLKRDVHAYVSRKQADGDFHHTNNDSWLHDEQDAANLAAKECDFGNFSEEERNIETLKSTLQVLRDRLLTDYFKETLLEFKDYKVIKYARVFQMAFYLFGVRKWQVVERDTNKLDWKRSKKLVNDNFFNYIKYYDPCGEKTFSPPVYAMTKRLEADIDAINMEEVEGYSLSLSTLLRFVSTTVKLRIADVAWRRFKFT